MTAHQSEDSRRDIPEGYWWPLDLLLQTVRPGSQGDNWTWEHEYDDLWFSEVHQANCDRLATSMQTEGQLDPITLGPDGRAWDGHHRIVVAMRLGIDKVLCDTPPPAQTPPALADPAEYGSPVEGTR